MMINLQFKFKSRIRIVLNSTVAAATFCFYCHGTSDPGFALPIRLVLSIFPSTYRTFLNLQSSGIIL